MSAVRLTSVEVVGALPVADAPSPQVTTGASGALTGSEPALVLQGSVLSLRVVLEGAAGTQPVEGSLSGPGIGLQLRADGPSTLVSGGALASLVAEEPLPRGVAVRPLELTVTVGGRPCRGAPVPLRLYTTYAPPRANGQPASRLPHAGKVHLEHACGWAAGASRVIAEGPDSIPHQVDNHMRHYVHPGEGHASAYRDLPPPANYEQLPGHAEIRAGERPLAPIFTPVPPGVSEEDYRAHYAANFGWQVLDHPTHPGGRCSQQASLVCAILGTLGVEARVVLLERTAAVRRGFRRVAAYQAFRARAFGDQWWDSHGIAEVPLEDGTLHYYDGSFSEPQIGDGRVHGTREEAFVAKCDDPRGLFVHTWGPWLYREDEAEVPRRNWPDRWEGLP